jgi:hypothetical protein
MRAKKKKAGRGKGYQPKLNGLIGKDGKPVLSLDPKDLKPPKGGTSIVRRVGARNENPPQP